MSVPFTPFARRHKGQSESYGPFGFLNPTIRKLPLTAEELESHSSGGEGDGGPKPPKRGNTEIRAEDVQLEFRTRDNRKGWALFNSDKNSLLISCAFQADMP
jgi:hypothetical protein